MYPQKFRQLILGSHAGLFTTSLRTTYYYFDDISFRDKLVFCNPSSFLFWLCVPQKKVLCLFFFEREEQLLSKNQQAAIGDFFWAPRT